MGRAAKVTGAIFMLMFTLIMASYTYNAWTKSQAANEDVEVAKAELEQAKADCYEARNNFVSQYGELPEEYKNRSCETGQ